MNKKLFKFFPTGVTDESVALVVGEERGREGGKKRKRNRVKLTCKGGGNRNQRGGIIVRGRTERARKCRVE